jgi:hypothetical protein
MASYVTVHLHNPAAGREAELTGRFRDGHVAAVARLRGFRGVQRFEVAGEQIMVSIPQPWRYATIYDFESEDPAIDMPALAPHIADLRDAGLIADDDTERLYTYRMYSPWYFSGNHRPGPLSHVMLLLANVTPGRTVEYHRWYDDQHRIEVSESPGYVGMRRGELAPVQVPPVRYCPGDQLILGGLQTGDLAGAVAEFTARGMGKSTTGPNWGPRSSAASTARTVHMFASVDGPYEAGG